VVSVSVCSCSFSAFTLSSFYFSTFYLVLALVLFFSFPFEIDLLIDQYASYYYFTTIAYIIII
jgi:hypothetical protein